MKLNWPKAGMYVLAVSGGVDSMVLLDLLAKLSQAEPGWSLVVAHFDHGMRTDSDQDRELVESAAANHNLEFVSAQASLGPKASEATARTARYQFLEAIRKAYQAQAIMTAHHQDDVIETALINLLRGTKRRGLTSLQSTEWVIRPLLDVTKADLIDYAQAHELVWREDATNQDTVYLRNRLRKELNQSSGSEQRQFASVVKRQQAVNKEADKLIKQILKLKVGRDGLERTWFIRLDHSVASEIMASWLRTNGIRDFNQAVINRLVVGAKVGQAGKIYPIVKGKTLAVSQNFLALKTLER